MESAYLSERGDVSAIVNEETENKTVDQISGLYDCRASDPEKCSFDCDPGQWIIPLSDSQQCNIVHNGYCAITWEMKNNKKKNDNNIHFSNFYCTGFLRKWRNTEQAFVGVLRIMELWLFFFDDFLHYRSLLYLMDVPIRIRRYSDSRNHMESMLKWFELVHWFLWMRSRLWETIMISGAPPPKKKPRKDLMETKYYTIFRIVELNV
jgi:hypothetical protein